MISSGSACSGAGGVSFVSMLRIAPMMQPMASLTVGKFSACKRSSGRLKFIHENHEPSWFRISVIDWSSSVFNASSFWLALVGSSTVCCVVPPAATVPKFAIRCRMFPFLSRFALRLSED